MGYWENRQAQAMYENMKSAEEVSQELADIYAKASRHLSYEIDGIYEKFRDKHGLTDKEAMALLNTLKNKNDIAALRQALAGKAKTDPGYADILAKLESQAYGARIERLEQLQTEIDRMMKEVYKQEKKITTSHYKDLAENSYYREIYNVQRRVGFQFSFSAVDPKKIDLLLRSTWSGANYSARIWKNTQGLADEVKEQLIIGLLTGKREEEMAKEIANKYATGAFEARRLVRTESNFVNGQMQLAAYEECDAEQYEFVATLDLLTSEACRELDGKVFPVKDAKPGVNMNPMHPFCRSTTIIHLGGDVVPGLKRRARDPETGENKLVPASMNYQEWYDKNVKGKGLEKPKKTKKGLNSKAADDTIKAVEKPVAEEMRIENFPPAFREKAEAKSTQALIDYVNGLKDADANVVKLYNSMGKMENISSNGIPFKISHAKSHSVNYSYRPSTGKLSDVKLTIPKLAAGAGPGAVNTTLHENMHLIDMYLRENPELRGHFRSTPAAKVLDEALGKVSPDIGKKAEDLFRQYDEEYAKIRKTIKEAYDQKIKDLTDQFYPDGVNVWEDVSKYKKYEKERKKLYTLMGDEIDAGCRDAMGGGIGELQDIYDALSGGRARDSGAVHYGHGSSYFRSLDKKKAEIIANYGALSVTRSDLIDLLREDKPELVEALDKMVEEMLKRVGD